MDHGTNDSEPQRIGSFSRISSTNSSLRRHSFNLLVTGHPEVDDDSESRSVSEAGDIGDRALHSKRHSGSVRPRFSVDSLGENVDVPIQEDALKQLQLQIENEKQVPWFVSYISCLLHLAVFGILGVLTRYLLQKLFGPEVVGATSNESYMYLDLPPNMVGSFLMGWWGVVFKQDISKFSEELAVGLTTGYLGSLTTFSGWNQKMLELSVDGRWVFSMLGFLLGLFLVAYSFMFGVETAKGFRWTFKRINLSSKLGISSCKRNCKVDDTMSRTIIIVVMVMMLGLLWGLSGTFLRRGFNSDSSETQLWFGCIVGPIGVWTRFYLARLNGHGLGRKDLLKWIPFGTLIANVSAACLMAALATTKKAVNNKSFDIVASGMQFGLCGCLSTVSTFVSEFGAMRQSMHPWRAYVYAWTTIIISFSLGTLIYSIPVWTKGYS